MSVSLTQYIKVQFQTPELIFTMHLDFCSTPHGHTDTDRAFCSYYVVHIFACIHQAYRSGPNMTVLQEIVGAVSRCATHINSSQLILGRVCASSWGIINVYQWSLNGKWMRVGLRSESHWLPQVDAMFIVHHNVKDTQQTRVGWLEKEAT